MLTVWVCLCLEQTPFTLTLRLWDIYILEGERVLTAMAYTILKLHKSKCLARWGGGEPLGDELPRSHQAGDRVWCSAQVSPSQCCHPKAVFLSPAGVSSCAVAAFRKL